MTTNFSMEDIQMEKMRNTLLAQGLDAAMVDSMLVSFKPKKDKAAKKSGWHPGMASTSNKVDKTITAKTYCQCCGNVMVQEITIKAVSKDSPDE